MSENARDSVKHSVTPMTRSLWFIWCSGAQVVICPRQGKMGQDSWLSTLSYTQQQAFGAGRGRRAFNTRKGELGNMNRRMGVL